MVAVGIDDAILDEAMGPDVSLLRENVPVPRGSLDGNLLFRGVLRNWYLEDSKPRIHSLEYHTSAGDDNLNKYDFIPSWAHKETIPVWNLSSGKAQKVYIGFDLLSELIDSGKHYLEITPEKLTELYKSSQLFDAKRSDEFYFEPIPDLRN